MKLRPYQITGRDFLAARTRALLADEMRVGKTPQAILAADKIGADKVLVVCPAIGVAHWIREFNKWTPNSLHGFAVYSYDKARRMPSLLKDHWDVVIADECHFAKNPEAQRTKLVYGKGGLGWCADRMWALSGTPAPKHAGELWPMMRAFGLTRLTYDAFLQLYCRVDGYGLVRGSKEKMIPELRAILAPTVLRRTRREVAPEMPGIDYQILTVDPTGVDLPPHAAWNEYNPGAYAAERQAVAMAKVKPLVDQIAFAIENELLKQTVVFGWHLDPLYAVVDGLRARGIVAQPLTGQNSLKDRERVQKEFREGTC